MQKNHLFILITLVIIVIFVIIFYLLSKKHKEKYTERKYASQTENLLPMFDKVKQDLALTPGKLILNNNEIVFNQNFQISPPSELIKCIVNIGLPDTFDTAFESLKKCALNFITELFNNGTWKKIATSLKVSIGGIETPLDELNLTGVIANKIKTSCSNVCTADPNPDNYYGRGGGWCSCKSGQTNMGLFCIDNDFPWSTHDCSCEDDEDEYGGLCYHKCKDGYRPTGCCFCSKYINWCAGAGIQVHLGSIRGLADCQIVPNTLNISMNKGVFNDNPDKGTQCSKNLQKDPLHSLCHYLEISATVTSPKITYDGQGNEVRFNVVPVFYPPCEEDSDEYFNDHYNPGSAFLANLPTQDATNVKADLKIQIPIITNQGDKFKYLGGQTILNISNSKFDISNLSAHYVNVPDPGIPGLTQLFGSIDTLINDDILNPIMNKVIDLIPGDILQSLGDIEIPVYVPLQGAQYKTCDPKCEINGVCNDGICLCTKGYSGLNCDTKGCPGKCGGYTCNLSTGTCNCPYGTSGNECEIHCTPVCPKHCGEPDSCSGYCRNTLLIGNYTGIGNIILTVNGKKYPGEIVPSYTLPTSNTSGFLISKEDKSIVAELRFVTTDYGKSVSVTANSKDVIPSGLSSLGIQVGDKFIVDTLSNIYYKSTDKNIFIEMVHCM